MVRTTERAKEAKLVEHHIIPVIGDPNSPDSIFDYIKQSGIIIECAAMTDKSEYVHSNY